MRKQFVKLFLFLSVSTGLFVTTVCAQTDQEHHPLVSSSLAAAAPEDSWGGSLAELRKSMNSILEKNEALASENTLLRKKILDLQGQLKTLQGEKEKFSQEPLKLKDLLDKKSQEVLLLEKSTQQLKEKVSQLESSKAALEKTIAQKEERQKSLDNEIDSLKGQIGQLEGKVKVAHDEHQRFLKNFEDEKKRLSRPLDEGKTKQNKVEKDVLDAQKRFSESADKIKALSQEQDRLTGDLKKAKSDLESAIREKQRLQGENARLTQGTKGGPDKLNQEIESLKTRNKELDATLTSLKDELARNQDMATKSIGQVQELQDNITAQQQANNALNEKISEQLEAINKLNREKVMLESLLDINSQTLKKYTKTIDTKDSANSQHQMMGYKYAANGQYEKAIEEYKAALRVDSSQKDVYYNLGFIYVKLGNFDDAIVNYTQVLRLDPNDKEACYYLSFIYKRLSNTAKAQEYYNRYLELKK